MKRTASAEWTGGLRDGQGTFAAESGVLNGVPFSYATRFEEEPGTNPEQLIGAAHAGCFSMAFAGKLGAAGLSPESIRTTAEVTLEKREAGFTVTAVHLVTRARVPGADEAAFRKAAEDAKAGCPISRLLNAEITLDAQLEG